MSLLRERSYWEEFRIESILNVICPLLVSPEKGLRWTKTWGRNTRDPKAAHTQDAGILSIQRGGKELAGGRLLGLPLHPCIPSTTDSHNTTILRTISSIVSTLRASLQSQQPLLLNMAWGRPLNKGGALCWHCPAFVLLLLIERDQLHILWERK